MLKPSVRVGSALIFASLLVGLLSVPAAAGTVTRWVDDDGHAGAGGCDSSREATARIQRAINRSGPGDTVLVCPGVYSQFVGIVGSGKDGLTVRSIRPHAAIIRAPSVVPVNATGVADVVSIVAVKDVRFRGFKLVFPTSAPCLQYEHAIAIGAGSRRITVSGNLITAVGTDTFGDSNGCGYRVGVDMVKGLGSVIAHDTIRDFVAAGIQAHGVGEPSISSNTVSYLHKAEDEVAPDCASGISLSDGSDALVASNSIVGIPSAGHTTAALCDGISIGDAGSAFAVHDNLVRYADSGIQLLAATGGTVARNTVRSSRLYGISLLSDVSTSVLHNQVHSTVGAGILVDDLTDGANVRHNDFTNNNGTDCIDASTGGAAGSPHYGTTNTWVANLGDEADPSGICHP